MPGNERKPSSLTIGQHCCSWLPPTTHGEKTMISTHLKDRFDALRLKVSQKKNTILGAVASVGGSTTLLVAGAGNYTTQYTPTATATALSNIGDYVAFVLDVLTAVGNWFVTNPAGELIIAMSVVMFAFIMIKSFFRRGGGRRR